ncbi:tetratricopeptide repeat protein [Streptomyces sp. 3MP-14]|uniref:Tetratricopeptide repeat protein n=1 Tax=Streptomyces mimosae TaxID=2586635 RepID=A0A5N6ABT1_9ACTN|nr:MULTISPECIES: tetratricopeptide repeat protein [Streptomyces]KAB8166287.1 tetratricopeptide repeat protein [Streptomyces mimosae]KAB8174080.1 tetratricopeptide repeat protein [Streptomyces sp. 3MP-14]
MLRQWVQLLRQAAEDTADAGVAGWAERLTTASEAEHPVIETVTVLLTAPELDTAPRALALAARGAAYQDNYDHERALADFERALALDPNDIVTLTEHGVACQQLERFDEALRSLDHAVERAPDHGWIYALRGHTHHYMGRDNEAIADLDRAVGLLPEDTTVLALCADLHRKLGRYDEAIAGCRRSIALNAEYGWPHAIMADACFWVGRHKEAIAAGQRAIALNPDDAGPSMTLAASRRVLGCYEDALADLDRAIALDPSAAAPRAFLPYVYLQTGRYPEAIAAFSRYPSGEQDPFDLPPIVIAGAEARLLSGGAEQASAELAALPDGFSDNAWAGVLAALAARRLGRAEEETAHWRRVEEIRATANTSPFFLYALRPEPQAAVAELDRLLATADLDVETLTSTRNTLERFERAGFADPAVTGPLRERLTAAFAEAAPAQG